MNNQMTGKKVKGEIYMENGSTHLRLRGNPSDPTIKELMKRFPTFILENEEESE